MRSRKERVQILLLIVLVSILLVYIGHIIYLNSRIQEMQSQNMEVMDQMRVLYELEKHAEFNVDSNFGQDAPEISEINYYNQETDHFKIYAHNSKVCDDIASSIENVYDKIIEDLDFKSQPNRKIKIYIFSNEDEYRAKIRQPMWSVGLAIYNKNSFYSFEGVNLTGLIPHEITHLLLYSYMGRKYDPLTMRWLSEGLATYEESKVVNSSLINSLEKRMSILKQGRYFPIRELIKADILKKGSTALIDLWYAQSLSTIEFMIHKLGRAKFNRFCLNMRKEDDVERALLDTYKNQFKNIDDFQDQWYRYIKAH